jgi:regulator of replication initiation timing
MTKEKIEKLQKLEAEFNDNETWILQHSIVTSDEEAEEKAFRLDNRKEYLKQLKPLRDEYRTFQNEEAAKKRIKQDQAEAKEGYDAIETLYKTVEGFNAYDFKYRNIFMEEVSTELARRDEILNK